MSAFTLKRSRRARYMRLTVQPGGDVVVVAPSHSSATSIEKFLRRHSLWIERARSRMARLKSLPVSGRRAYLRHKEDARAFVEDRVAHWSRVLGCRHGRIAIKNTGTIWGSCSARGNLNFSYSLLFLPRALADYVVVHELCHLRERNHGARFWSLVGAIIPDYRSLRRELRTYVLKRS